MASKRMERIFHAQPSLESSSKPVRLIKLNFNLKFMSKKAKGEKIQEHHWFRKLCHFIDFCAKKRLLPEFYVHAGGDAHGRLGAGGWAVCRRGRGGMSPQTLMPPRLLNREINGRAEMPSSQHSWAPQTKVGDVSSCSNSVVTHTSLHKSQGKVVREEENEKAHPEVCKSRNTSWEIQLCCWATSERMRKHVINLKRVRNPTDTSEALKMPWHWETSFEIAVSARIILDQDSESFWYACLKLQGQTWPFALSR